MRRAVALVVAASLCQTVEATGAASAGRHTLGFAAACRSGSASMARLELYFGAGGVPDHAWKQFLATVVTPRFPDGFTGYAAYGQWRNSGRITREQTRVLVIFHPSGRADESRIEAIRDLYKKRFGQISVLRADSRACVSF